MRKKLTPAVRYRLNEIVIRNNVPIVADNYAYGVVVELLKDEFECLVWEVCLPFAALLKFAGARNNVRPELVNQIPMVLCQ